MRALVKFSRFVDAISEFLGAISMYLVLVTFIVGFMNVVLRYLGRFAGIRLTSNLLIEMQWYLYSLIFLFGFSYILKHGINVRVDFWYGNWTRKTKAWVDFVGNWIALIPFTLLALWVTYQPVLRSWGLLRDGTWGTWEMSPDPSGLPRAPIKSMIIFAFVTLFFQAISEQIKLLAVLRGQEALVDIEELEAPLRIE